MFRWHRWLRAGCAAIAAIGLFACQALLDFDTNEREREIGDPPSDAGSGADVAGSADGSTAPKCLACPRVIFMTSTKRTGNLGGLEGADKLCQDVAGAAGLAPAGKIFKAWLSDSMRDAKSRLTQSLKAAINTDEHGTASATLHKAWSATAPNGTRLPDHNCNDWTNGNMGESGSWGDTSATDAEWTDTGMTTHCATDNHLYCLEQ